MTADGRYGPYGYHDDKPEYARKKVNWDKLNWAGLQNECLDRNKHRFGDKTPLGEGEPRMKLRGWKENIPPMLQGAREPRDKTLRTAIVLRGWEEFEFTREDKINLRSIVVETALRSGGEYTVFLLVHVRNSDRAIFDSPDNYAEALADLVAPEFRSIAVLFDDNLLESWYPKTTTHQ